MKKISLTLIAIVFAINFSYAQWTGAPGNIYYNTGNVGIGTTSPTGQLSFNNQIQNTSNSNNPINYTATTGVVGQAIINSYYVGNSDGNGPYPRYLDIASVGSPDGINGGGNIRFLTNPIAVSSPAIERMRINSAGDVGIGNTLVYGRAIISTSETKNNSIPTAASTALFLSTNESDTPFGVKFGVVGNTSAINRYVSIQTGEHNVANNGILSLQPAGGNVGIGTANPDQKLTVKGTIHSQEVIVDMNVLPDYVFKPAYHLPTLNEVKTYIDQNHHLPEMPSAEQVAKDGLSLGEMNAKLLKKVEELTLYLIEKDKELNNQQAINQAQTDKLNIQQKEIDELKQQVSTLIKPKP